MSLDIEKIKATLSKTSGVIANSNLPNSTAIYFECLEALAALESYDPDAIRPSESAKELATKLFDGVALRVDQFFKARNIQGGVKSGEDMFLAIDTLELSKSIERYAEGRADAIRRECYLAAKLAVEDSQYDGSGYYQVDMLKLEAAIMNAGKE